MIQMEKIFVKFALNTLNVIPGAESSMTPRAQFDNVEKGPKSQKSKFQIHGVREDCFQVFWP